MLPILRKLVKFFKTQGKYKVNVETVSAIVDVRKHQRAEKVCLKRHHIVALMGFLIFVVLNSQRVNLSIAIVAMVNSSAEHVTVNSNITQCSGSGSRNTSEEVVTIQNPKGDFDWDPVLQGYILGAGTVSYVLIHIPGGRCVDIFGAKKVITISIFVASVCNLVTPAVAYWSVYALITVHFIKGLAQGVLQPSGSVLMSQWFPPNERGYLSSIMLSGIYVGAFIGGVISGVLCDIPSLGGWTSAFYSMGLLGTVVLVLLLFLLPDFSSEVPKISEVEKKYISESPPSAVSKDICIVPWKEIFTSVSCYALFIGQFGQSWVGFYFLTVHPIYMGTILNHSMTEIGLITSLPYFLACFTSLSASKLSDWLNEKKFASVCTVRKGCRFVCTVGFCLAFGGIYIAECNKVLHNIFLTLAMASTGFSIPSTLILPADMTPKFSGTLMGIACAIGNCSGFIIPVITGMIIEQENTIAQWHKVFLITIAIEVTTSLFLVIFGSAQVQPWDKSAKRLQRSCKELHDTKKPSEC